MSAQLAIVEPSASLPTTIEESNRVMREFFSYTPTMADMVEIQKFMQSDEYQDRVPLEPKHHFADGIYSRELTIPAGILVVGKRHAKGHFTALMSGTAIIVNDEGVQELTGPVYWADNAGVKRAVYACSDATFVTYHASTATDVSELEKELINSEEYL